MTKKEYDKIMSYATFGELVQILFWKPKRRMYFDAMIEDGYPFMKSYNLTKFIGYRSLNEWYSDHMEAIKK